jgi:hypothetical protein
LVDAIAPGVTAYVTGTSGLPVLKQGRADAAYWFHEALAEPVCTENLKSDHSGDEVRQGWRVI